MSPTLSIKGRPPSSPASSRCLLGVVVRHPSTHSWASRDKTLIPRMPRGGRMSAAPILSFPTFPLLRLLSFSSESSTLNSCLVVCPSPHLFLSFSIVHSPIPGSQGETLAPIKRRLETPGARAGSDTEWWWGAERERGDGGGMRVG